MFDVAADGHVLFSKRSAGRFPTDEEIAGKIRSLDR